MGIDDRQVKLQIWDTAGACSAIAEIERSTATPPAPTAPTTTAPTASPPCPTAQPLAAAARPATATPTATPTAPLTTPTTSPKALGQAGMRVFTMLHAELDGESNIEVLRATAKQMLRSGKLLYKKQARFEMMGSKERPNKLIRDYGRATKVCILFLCRGLFAQRRASFS